jgi:hypothetical protein
VVTIVRVVLLIGARAGLLDASRERRDREHILAELARREFGTSNKA